MAKKAKKLNKKQQEILQALSHQELLNKLLCLMEKHPDIQNTIVEEWLQGPEERLKQLTKRYTQAFKKASKGNRFYDYYETNHFFTELEATITNPLQELAPLCPIPVAKLAYQLIEDFEELTNTMDTSSGSWDGYYQGASLAYLIALSHYPLSAKEDVAIQLYNLSQEDPWFSFDSLKQKGVNIPKEVKTILRDYYLEYHNPSAAFTLSIMIRDIDTAQTLLSHSGNFRAEDLLELARLLMDELETEQAIRLLETIQPQIPVWTHHYLEWVKLISQAYKDNSQTDKAQAIIIQSFKKAPTADYWRLYLKMGGDEQQDLPAFIEVAKKQGLSFLIMFLADLSDYQAINELLNDPQTKLEPLIESLNTSFCRKLTGTLAKCGYYQAACLLRQQLAQNTIERAQSRYYKYAISDIKKLIDYSLESKQPALIQSTQQWLQALYQQHKRKTSLWYDFDESIAQAVITDKGIELIIN